MPTATRPHFIILTLVLLLQVGILPSKPSHAQNIDGFIGGVIQKLGEAAEKEARKTRRGRSRALRVQEWLIWGGDYGGPLDGDIGPNTQEAIKIFQRRQGFPSTGRLSRSEIARLRSVARSEKRRLGFRKVKDASTGILLPLPTKLFDNQTESRFGLVRYASSNSDWVFGIRSYSIQQDTESLSRRIQASEFANQITWQQVKDDRLIFSGDRGQEKFYVRLERRGRAYYGFYSFYPSQQADYRNSMVATSLLLPSRLEKSDLVPSGTFGIDELLQELVMTLDPNADLIVSEQENNTAAANMEPPALASDSEICVVSDPTGTPLNVRSTPQGTVLRQLKNGTRVAVADEAKDDNGKPWAFVVDEAKGTMIGWVFQSHLRCHDAVADANAAAAEQSKPEPAPPASNFALKDSKRPFSAHPCDTLAAHPADPDRRAEGKAMEQIEPSRAIEACKEAVSTHPDEDRFQFQLGRAYHAAKDYSNAMKWYQKSAEQGHTSAERNIGAMYEKGEGAEQDYSEALLWYRKSAYHGDASAQRNIGRLYYQGLGVEQDYSEALFWYRKAAAQGNAAAQSSIGYLYEKGLGVDQNPSKALVWYRKAADQGNAWAQVKIGFLYHGGLGVKQDYSEALGWYRKAADQGDADAQYMVGSYYHMGWGVERIYPKAFAWYKKAADQGDAGAQLEIGNFYRGGLGVDQNPSEALVWYRKAADQGDAEAQLEIGNLYREGLGVDQNYSEALAWYRKAAEQGNESAQNAEKSLSALLNRDPNDVVAQVLNYSTFGKDDGLSGSFWYRVSRNQCDYQLKHSKQMENMAVWLFFMGRGTLRTEIKLSELDPQRIQFKQVPQFDDLGRPRGMTTQTMYDGKVLLVAQGELPIDRLQRGWSLIYEKYCEGKEAPF